VTPPPPGHGGLAEEVARLVEAVGLLAAGYAGTGTREPDGTAPGRSTGASCPLCRLTAAVRGLRPEVAEHLAAAAEELLAAARELAAGALGEEAWPGPGTGGAPPRAPGDVPAGGPPGTGPSGRRPRRVERIEVD
jgi:hypothetical protein